MWEERLIDLQEGLLVVDEEIEQVALVPVGKVSDLDPILGQLSQPEQALLELFRLLRALLKLLELLPVVYLILQPPLHYVFADLLDAVDEQSLQLVAFGILIHSVCNDLLLLRSLSINDRLQVPNRIRVACF
jgi:hypothetical protein